MRHRWLVTAGVALVGAVAATETRTVQSTPTAAAVVLVTIDGTRWQDLFAGVDLDILTSVSGKTPVEQTETYTRFWAPTPEASRAKVMPFLWTRLVAQEGVIHGNRRAGSRMQLANTQRVSYPGYSELLTGAPHDDAIAGNTYRRYPFLTVLEWLRADLRLPKSGVAVFGSWKTFRMISEREEGTITINAGYEDFEHPDPEVRTLSALQHLAPTGFDGARHDVYTFRFGLAHLQTARPRVLYLAFDETDDWAHQRRYDLVLDALHRTDRQLEQLWTWLQGEADYRGRTTLVLTVDHGRGRRADDWIDHGAAIAGAEETWVGCFGATVAARGESRDPTVLSTRQIASTVGAILGRDFRSAVPDAAPPIPMCLGSR